MKVPQFKNIVCLFVTEVVQDFEGVVRIGGRERFKWGFIKNIMKKIYI